ncbi:MAG: MFS transporter, partial [Enterobacter hormaechei]|nr:MFS transporter [Enterobacter hormaechei]
MSLNNKQWLGLPLSLVWGYIAIAVFMTGDGFELAFLSHYIKALGFTPAEASFAFTLYGLAAALSAWISGVVAEIITPQKTMLIGFVLWCVFHVLFLGSDSTSAALGWFWAVYSIGIGVFGSYIPSFTIPHIGEMGTLWLALAFCVTGGIIALVSMRKVETPRHMQTLSTREKFAELGRAATLLYTNRSILLSSMVRIINTLSLFGFAVIMPMMFVDELGFTTSEWLQVWAVFFFTTIFSNVFWGVVAEKMGWMRVVRWFGCIGMALSSLAFYYIPQHFGHNFAMALVPAIALGIFVAAFVPMAAVFPALEPRHKGAAI